MTAPIHRVNLLRARRPHEPAPVDLVELPLLASGACTARVLAVVAAVGSPATGAVMERQ
jgi:hypothetical protein